MYIHLMASAMVRKQIYLTRVQDRRLKQEAARRRLAEAEIIRTALDRELGGAAPRLDIDRDPFWGVIGLGRSGRGDLSENVDRQLYGVPRRRR
jgi:hypothetical protein